jgi:hypothetical protein
MSAATPGVTADFGEGRTLREGQFLRSPGGPVDRSGDFTLQMWVKLDNPQEFQSTIYADWNSAVSGGFNLAPDDATNEIYLCSFWAGAPDASCATGMRPGDTDWHFYRVRRSVENASIQLCIDGRLVITDPNPGANDMTSDQPPHIGRNVDYNPAYFKGAVDEIRSFKTALPCPTP